MPFWDKVYADTATPAPTSGPQRPWWQDAPQVTGTQFGGQPATGYGGLQQQSGMSSSGLESDRDKANRLKSTNDAANNMSAEDMEWLASYELQSDKYNNVCPQCGSGNYIPAGTRMPGVGMMPTEKCFDCGLSARGPEPSLGGTGKGASKSTRQIDTGGAGGVGTYMAFNGVPRSYLPRG